MTLVDNPPDDSRVVVEEAFGAMLSLMESRDAGGVVTRADNAICIPKAPAGIIPVAGAVAP